MPRWGLTTIKFYWTLAETCPPAGEAIIKLHTRWQRPGGAACPHAPRSGGSVPREWDHTPAPSWPAFCRWPRLAPLAPSVHQPLQRPCRPLVPACSSTPSGLRIGSSLCLQCSSSSQLLNNFHLSSETPGDSHRLCPSLGLSLVPHSASSPTPPEQLRRCTISVCLPVVVCPPRRRGVFQGRVRHPQSPLQPTPRPSTQVSQPVLSELKALTQECGQFF